MMIECAMSVFDMTYGQAKVYLRYISLALAISLFCDDVS